MASVVNGATKSSDDYHMAAGTVAFLSTVQPNWTPHSIKCPLPWNELRVVYDGDVTACCWQPGSRARVTLDNIWTGEALRELRDDLLGGVIPKLWRHHRRRAFRAILICS
jgi:Iron-sulfur cluster-binding domain